VDLDELAGTPVETRITFRCDSGFHMEVINNRWIKRPCKGTRCRVVGVHFHIWDLLTGRKVKDLTETVIPAAGDTQQKDHT
jgi:hypothetical protein